MSMKHYYKMFSNRKNPKFFYLSVNYLTRPKDTLKSRVIKMTPPSFKQMERDLIYRWIGPRMNKRRVIHRSKTSSQVNGVYRLDVSSLRKGKNL